MLFKICFTSIEPSFFTVEIVTPCCHSLSGKETIKKSNFLRIFWIVSLVLNMLVFLAGIKINQYILYSNIAVPIVEMLVVGSTVLLLYKNKPRYPIALALSVLSFALSKSSMWIIKLDISLYKIWKTGEALVDILYSCRYIILTVALFLLVYIIPRKISKWLVWIPALAVTVVRFIKLVEAFAFVGILSFIIDLGVFAVFVLFALSCSRNAKYEYVTESKKDKKKNSLKIGIISASASVGIVVIYLLVSAIVCSVQINTGIDKWKSKIVSGFLTTESHWDEMNDDIFKYTCTKFVSQFVDDNAFYETLTENRTQMRRIALCHSAYISGNIDNDIIDEFSYITADESWKNDTTLKPYYTKYIAMLPDINAVTASASVDVNGGKITVTVKNENKMPISKCTVECDFTIMFIESGYSTSIEYGRGSKTIEVENIDGGSEQTQTISFNPDDYYDSYGSYITAILDSKNVSIVSIE